MRELIKKILKKSPLCIKKIILNIYEGYFFVTSQFKEKKEYTLSNSKNEAPTTNKKKILVYHISGLNFGGTEKNLQSIANGLCDDYSIYFMASNIGEENTRIDYIDKKIKLVPFTFTWRETTFPYFIHGMNPHIKKIIKEYGIDLIITAGSGYSEYPLNTIKKVPIVMINIFGSPTLQENIVKNIFISETIQKYSEEYTGRMKKNISLCIPVKEPIRNLNDEIIAIKKNHNLTESDFIFGRIGRNADSIFDPIGIKAFKIVVKKYPFAKYVIMSPPPILEKMVQDEKIPNIIFLPPSSKEEDVWVFHKSIDCLAHFRKDGETFGLNIAESMLVGNPIISHKSHIWNAHVEYLEKSFSRVAEHDNVDQYASYMEEFINLKINKKEEWLKMRKVSEHIGVTLFSEKKYIEKVSAIVKNILS